MRGDALDDLATWLRAQLDEDERVARAAAETASYHFVWHRDALLSAANFQEQGRGIVWDQRALEPEQNRHAKHWDPVRVLAELAAKRRILRMWVDYTISRWDLPEGVHDGRDDDERMRDDATARLMDRIVLLLAQPYADRPGYRPEWRAA